MYGAATADSVPLYGDVVLALGIFKKPKAFRESYGRDTIIVVVLDANVVNPFVLPEVLRA